MDRDYYLDDLDSEYDEEDIKTKGSKENHRAEKIASLGLSPFTGQVEVPHDLHGFIIGKRGSDVRSMMRQYGVIINIPRRDDHSDIITIKGPTSAKVEQTKAALRRRIEQFKREERERLLRSFQLTVEVDPEYYSKIIGRGGITVKKIRQDHNVKINIPKGGERKITIIGHEKDARAARYAILKLVQKEEAMYKEKVQIDPSIYSRLIGSRGHNILKIKDQYKVEFRFPRPSDPETDLILIQGAEEDVLNAKDYLIKLEEEYLQEIKKRDLKEQRRRNETLEKAGNSTRDKMEVAVASYTTNTQEASTSSSGWDIPSEPES